jgi:hypothetical protein
MNSIIDWPKQLSSIIGAAGDAANWNPIVADLLAGQGVLQLGSVLSVDASGKMKLTDATSYAQAFGILLETIDTGTDAAATDEFTGTIARQGSFKAPELVMAPGAVLVGACADALRKNGIYLEGAANFVVASAERQQP